MKKALGVLALLLANAVVCSALQSRTILVFPFENKSGRSDLNWISEGIAVTLSSRMATPTNYVLGRDERDRAYDQLDIPPGTPLTLASEYKIAQTLGVDWALVGSFDVKDRRLSISAQLLDMRRLKLTPPINAVGNLVDLDDLETDIAWRLLAMYDPSYTVGTEDDFRQRFPPVHLDAFENYIRGILATDDATRVRFLREANRLDPSDHRAAFQLGRYYFNQKDYAESEKWLRKIEPKDENYHGALFRLAIDDYFLGHLDTAEKFLEGLAKQIPLNEVWNNLGVVEIHRGRYAEALADFQQAYKGDSSDPVFRYNLAACLWRLHRYREVVQIFGQDKTENEQNAQMHRLLASAFSKLGDTASYERELQWLVAREGSPLDPSELSQDFSAETRIKRNYDGRAFHLLALAISNARENRLKNEPPAPHGSSYLARGKSLLAEGRLSEAERELTKAASLLPKNSEVHLVLGRVYEAEGRHHKAEKELETSLQLKDSVAAHLSLAHIYLSLGQPDAARLQSQAALELDPGNQDATRLIDQIKSRAVAPRKTP